MKKFIALLIVLASLAPLTASAKLNPLLERPAKQWPVVSTNDPCDQIADDWFSQYICYAITTGFVTGYEN